MKYRLMRGGGMLIAAISLIAGYTRGSRKTENRVEVGESPESRIHTIPDQASDLPEAESGFFLEEVPAADSEEVDYWLGRHGSGRKVWIGESDTMPLKQAMKRAQEMIRRWNAS